MSPTRRSFRFDRSCMRCEAAKLRVPIGRCCSLRWAAAARKVLQRVVWRHACDWLALAATRYLSMLFNAKRFPVASRCFSLLLVVSLCSRLLPAACPLLNLCCSMLINASGQQSLWALWFLSYIALDSIRLR